MNKIVTLVDFMSYIFFGAPKCVMKFMFRNVPYMLMTTVMPHDTNIRFSHIDSLCNTPHFEHRNVTMWCTLFEINGVVHAFHAP